MEHKPYDQRVIMIISNTDWVWSTWLTKYKPKMYDQWIKMIITMSHEVGEWHMWSKLIKVAKLRSIEDGYKSSSIHLVGDRSYMDTTMVEIIFLIPEGRYNQELIPRGKE
jgi:hypothetical protein